MNDILKSLDEFNFKLDDFIVISIFLELMENEYIDYIHISDDKFKEFRLLFFKLNDDLHKLYDSLLVINDKLNNSYHELAENLKKCYL